MKHENALFIMCKNMLSDLEKEIDELEDELDSTDEPRDKRELADTLVAEFNAISDVIYDVGSCGECKHFDSSLGNFYGHGYCQKARDSQEALWTKIEVVSSWYCADFSRDK